MTLLAQFLLTDSHFTLTLLVALVCFAVAWLYFDAWIGRKDYREGTKALGFVLLCLSFVAHATLVEQTSIQSSILGSYTISYLASFFRIAGYLVLIIGQLIDPLQPLPGYREGKGFGIKRKVNAIVVPIAAIPLSEFILFAQPILAVVTAFLYLKRATAGLEHHLKPISWSLFSLSIYEVLNLASTFRSSTNITIANITAPFSLIWIAEHTMMVVFMLILGKWVWWYLVKRLETQLLMIFTTLILIIFLITTIFFTATSLNNIRANTLENLEINVKVLQYAVNGKKAESLSDAQVIAQNSEIVKGLIAKDRKVLKDLTTTLLLAKKQTFLVVTSDSGEILMRADDPEKSAGSLSDDPLVSKALKGQEASAVVVSDGSMAPEVSVRAATPILSDGKVIGSVVVGTLIDSAFVDGLKESTGLDASVYADNIRSATTFVAPDGKSRWVGIKEEDKLVKKNVLIEGNNYTGSVNVLNTPFYSAFSPLKNADNNTVGMLFVGIPQVTLMASAADSIGLTFLVTAVLLVLSMVPTYFVSRFIIDQIR